MLYPQASICRRKLAFLWKSVKISDILCKLVFRIMAPRRHHFKNLKNHWPNLLNIQSSSNTQNNIISSKVAKTHYISELQLNLLKHLNMCYCSFSKISIKRKALLQENFDLTKKIDFFGHITLESLLVSAWNLTCARFTKFERRRKSSTLLTLVTLVMSLQSSLWPSLSWCDAMMSLQFIHVHSFVCRGRLRNLQSDCSNVGLHCVTVTWQQIFKGSLQVTVANVLVHLIVVCRHVWQ